MRRLECLEAVHADLVGAAVVTNMGAVAAELHGLGHRDTFFYLQHAMGLASSLGLGVALAQPQRPVVVVDGDGSVLMNLGTFVTLARHGPPNLSHVVFDNGAYVSSGGTPTPTADGVDLAAVARDSGIAGARTVDTLDGFVTAFREDLAAGRVTVLVAKVEAVAVATFHMGLGLLENRFSFARALAGQPAR
ncbi:MAG TPA: thiamine pyrophosphate-dependent enzyme [Acidimicrobiia bacterium]|nr:thiamine pyrophosphate-dependent enzyme [Acidimicrobiia bacterium]